MNLFGVVNKIETHQSAVNRNGAIDPCTIYRDLGGACLEYVILSMLANTLTDIPGYQ